MHEHNDIDVDERGGGNWTTYTIAWVLCLAYSFHHAAFFVRDILDPVSLAGSDDKVCAPAIDMAIELVISVDAPFPRKVHAARRAVVQTIITIYVWVCLWK